MENKPAAEGRQESVVVFCADGLGDHILSIPAMNALAAGLGTRVTLVTRDGMTRLFYSGCAFTSVIEVPMSAMEHGWEFDSVRAAAGCPVAASCVVLVPYSSVALRSWLSIIAPRDIAWGHKALAEYAGDSTGAAHQVDRMIGLVRPVLGLTVPAMDLTWALPEEAWTWARCQKSGLTGGSKRLLVMHFETGGAKCLVPEEVTALVSHLHTALNDWSLVLVSEAVPAYRDKLLECGAHTIAGNTLERVFALVRSADAFLGCDSCMLHAADLGGVPSIGMFRSTNPAQWGLRFASGMNIHWPHSERTMMARRRTRSTQVAEDIVAWVTAGASAPCVRGR